MGLWIVIAIVLFALGSIMALKPSGVEQRLDTLRMTARKLGLHPKLVKCPSWVRGHQNEYGRGMIAQCGLILEQVKLPHAHFKVIDNQWRVDDGQSAQLDEPIATDFRLDKTPLDLPDSLQPFIKALSTRANSITIYWDDTAYIRPTSNPNFRFENIESDLQVLKIQLEKWATALNKR